MRNLLSLPFVLAVTIATSSIYGGGIRHDVPDASYRALANNEGDFAVGFEYPDFAGVGLVENTTTGDAGTGTLIHPRWILTAGHVIREEPHEDPRASDFVVRFGAVDGEFERAVQAEAIIMHPAWIEALELGVIIEESLVQGVDIALIKLTEAVNDIPLTPINVSRTETLNEPVYFCGFGNFGTGLIPPGNDLEPIKRASQNAADRVLTDIAVTIPGFETLLGGQIAMDFDNPEGTTNTLNGPVEVPDSDFADMRYLGDGFSSSTPFDFEGTPTPGDSGGPWLMRFGQTWTVVGVGSYGSLDDEVYGDISIATRVANFSGWLLPIIWEARLGQTVDVNDGWAWKQNAGFFYLGSTTWAYHETGGWLFPTDDIASGMWFYANNDNGWYWSREDLLPWAFRQSTDQWNVFFSVTE